MTFDGEHVFDGEGNAEQRFLRERCATGDQLIHGICLGERVGGVVTEKGVNLSVHAGDLVEARLHRFPRGDFAAGQLGGEFGDGELVQHGIRKGETFNIQHSTPNIELLRCSHRWSFGVEC